ncbi:class I SAM-dependent methyltransferase [Oleiharenicola lentus]|uniref:class I SAM-dependent methyltransferase n=1 Tax=Oleiharenicola lentus TaxID=2508720 RepID=UPI003F67D112
MSESHSVEGHLKLNVADYDKLIRQLVPGYAAMRAAHMELLKKFLPTDRRVTVLDLGGGTGALAEAVAETLPLADVEIWDIDRAMLGVARERCARFGDRVRYVEQSFTNPLTPCDAIVACIALHHVKDLTVKAAIYKNVFAALKPDGIFANADVAIAADGKLRDFSYQQWVDAMGTHGIDEPQANAHIASWAHEDYYPPLFTELELVAKAGFAAPEVFWRQLPDAIFGGVK